MPLAPLMIPVLGIMAGLLAIPPMVDKRPPVYSPSVCKVPDGLQPPYSMDLQKAIRYCVEVENQYNRTPLNMRRHSLGNDIAGMLEVYSMELRTLAEQEKSKRAVTTDFLYQATKPVVGQKPDLGSVAEPAPSREMAAATSQRPIKSVGSSSVAGDEGKEGGDEAYSAAKAVE